MREVICLRAVLMSRLGSARPKFLEGAYLETLELLRKLSLFFQVITILEELGVPYEVKSFKFDDVKKKPYTDINPNGRVPGR